MALIGSDFADFPMGASWEAATTANRDKFIRMMLGRLEPYGVTNDRVYTEAEMSALAAYVRHLYDLDGVGLIEPPNFTLRSLKASRRQQQGAFSLSPSAANANVPVAPPDGSGTGTVGVDNVARQSAATALARADQAISLASAPDVDPVARQAAATAQADADEAQAEADTAQATADSAFALASVDDVDPTARQAAATAQADADEAQAAADMAQARADAAFALASQGSVPTEASIQAAIAALPASNANKFQKKFVQGANQAEVDARQVGTVMHPDMNAVHNPVTAVSGNELVVQVTPENTMLSTDLEPNSPFITSWEGFIKTTPSGLSAISFMKIIQRVTHFVGETYQFVSERELTDQIWISWGMTIPLSGFNSATVLRPETITRFSGLTNNAANFAYKVEIVFQLFSNEDFSTPLNFSKLISFNISFSEAGVLYHQPNKSIGPKGDKGDKGDDGDDGDAGTGSAEPSADWIIPEVTPGTVRRARTLAFQNTNNIITSQTDIPIGNSVVHEGHLRIQGAVDVVSQVGTGSDFRRVQIFHTQIDMTRTNLGEVTGLIQSDSGNFDVTLDTDAELPEGIIALSIGYVNVGQDEYRFTTYSIDAIKNAPLATAVGQVADNHARSVLAEVPAYRWIDSAAQKQNLVQLPQTLQTLQTGVSEATSEAEGNTQTLNDVVERLHTAEAVTDHFTYGEETERVISWTDPAFTVEDAAATNRLQVDFGTLRNRDSALITIGAMVLLQVKDSELQGLKAVPSAPARDVTDTYYLARSNGAGGFSPIRLNHNPAQGQSVDGLTITYTQADIDANNANPGQPATDFPGTGNRHTVTMGIKNSVNGVPQPDLSVVMTSTENAKTERLNVMSGSVKVAELVVELTRNAANILARFTLENYTGLTAFTFDIRSSFPVVRSIPATPATTRLIDLGTIHGTAPAAFALVLEGMTQKVFYRINQQVGVHDTGMNPTGAAIRPMFDKRRYLAFTDGSAFNETALRSALAGNVADDYLGFRVAQDNEHRFLMSNIEVRAPNIGDDDSGMTAPALASRTVVYPRTKITTTGSTVIPSSLAGANSLAGPTAKGFLFIQAQSFDNFGFNGRIGTAMIDIQTIYERTDEHQFAIQLYDHEDNSSGSLRIFSFLNLSPTIYRDLRFFATRKTGTKEIYVGPITLIGI